jgi:hypothetical protein
LCIRQQFELGQQTHRAFGGGLRGQRSFVDRAEAASPIGVEDEAGLAAARSGRREHVIVGLDHGCAFGLVTVAIESELLGDRVQPIQCEGRRRHAEERNGRHVHLLSTREVSRSS